MRPILAKSFHKQVALRRTIPQQLLIIRKRTTDFAVHFGELDLLQEFACLDDVGEATERVVEVLERGSFHDHFTVANVLFQEFVQLD